MKYKIKLGDTVTEVNERNLKWYQSKGWKVVEKATPPIKKSDNFHQLTKAQLQELCKEKGIEFKHTDKKEVLRNKLDVVNDKSLFEKEATNKNFTDSLIKE